MALFLSLYKFTAAQQAEVAEYGARHGPNYEALCCTRRAPHGGSGVSMPAGPLWVVDTKRVQVGRGKKTYEAAKQLLMCWGHFQLGWAEVAPNTRVERGSPVVVVAKTLFVWCANPLKVMYIDEGRVAKREVLPGVVRGPGRRFEFAHGCCSGHSLAGEERFGVEWDEGDDSVWFEIYTVSRPAHAVSVLTYPLVRYYQSRFKEESAAAVVEGLRGSAAASGGRKGVGK
ncbi:hypothetical protein FOA52_006132 [Chlamydomonas sp. UWO 241]|nr:hypothetical protein FOA52_006132 [Chlamydomonas sp. UWO 241]